VFLTAVAPPDGSLVLDQIDPDVRGFVEKSIEGRVYHQEREPTCTRPLIAATCPNCSSVPPNSWPARWSPLEAGHMPMVSMPQQLAAALNDIGR
jgi:hypothetical protein